MTRPAQHRIFVGKDTTKFSAAHMTVFPDGTKERLHGHNFQVSIAVDIADIALQSFLDFGLLKTALQAQCQAWNERLLLPERCPYLKIASRSPEAVDFTLCNKRYVVPAEDVVMLPLENVVVETLAVAFCNALVERVGSALRRDVVLGLEVSVTESPGQGGVYYWTWPT